MPDSNALKGDLYKAATWFIGAVLVRLGWEVGGWLWMKLG